MQIRLHDHETTVLQRGDAGPAVVLLHSLGLDHRIWEPVLDQLAIGRRVFAYDLRGHGTATGSPHPFTLHDTARDLIGVLDALRLPQANIVGLSYGGAIAQTAAVAWPERFASLSLLATTDRRLPEIFEERAAAAESGGMQAQLEASLTRWFTPAALAADDPGVQYARDCVLAMDPADWAAAWRSMKDLDTQGKLADFRPPTMVVAGEEDLSGPPDFQREFAARIPGSAFRLLPGVPHLQPLERPELVAAALDEFLVRQ